MLLLSVSSLLGCANSVVHTLVQGTCSCYYLPRPGSLCRLPEYEDDDEDTAKGMARLFAEVGEAYINLVATAVQEVRAKSKVYRV